MIRNLNTGQLIGTRAAAYGVGSGLRFDSNDDYCRVIKETNIGNSVIGLPMYRISNGNELSVWTPSLTLGISDNSPIINIPAVLNNAAPINSINYLDRENLNFNITGFTTSKTAIYATNHNSPSDIENLSARVGLFVKFTFDNPLLSINTVYSNSAFNGFLFIESHTEIWLELSGNNIVGTQFLRSNGVVGQIPTNGVSTVGLVPLRNVAKVTSIQYKLFYPNFTVATPHTFAGITAIVFGNGNL